MLLGKPGFPMVSPSKLVLLRVLDGAVPLNEYMITMTLVGVIFQLTKELPCLKPFETPKRTCILRLKQNEAKQRSTRNHGFLKECENILVHDSSKIFQLDTGWWFGCHFLFSHILQIIIPTDFHILQRGGPTTNQNSLVLKLIRSDLTHNRGSANFIEKSQKD